MGYIATKQQSVAIIAENLKRVEKLIQSPYARPADIAVRDRLARRLREATEAH